ncbi:MAG: SpoIIE family protein phosphatase [Christensenellales bacterium]|jgi:hypothetical protein
MNDLFLDIGYNSLNKHGEQLCGDHVAIVEQEDDNAKVIVLADGLGSGVKACILSTLTAKIISTMMAESMVLTECVRTVAATLPVCEVRRIAYSTFSIIRITNNNEAELIQYDNPHIVLLRDGKNKEYPKTLENIDGKNIYKSKIQLRENDVFVAFSDGALHAGVGKRLNFGWQRKEIIEFLERLYKDQYTAKMIVTFLLEQCNFLYDGMPGDDTTACALKIRRRQPVNLIVGPPVDQADDAHVMSLFFSKEGKHIVCGGTTSELAARYLNKPLKTGIDYADPSIPPTASIEGVDLVTEGVITINKVLCYSNDYLSNNEYYAEWSKKKDGASLIARMLFEEATDINLFVGRAVNPAHQNPGLPIDFSIKMRLVDELAQALRKMGKHIKVSYF